MAIDEQDATTTTPAPPSPTSTATAGTTSLVGRRNGGVEIYLQGLDGQFMLEQSPELDIGDAYINDLAVVADGQEGSVRSWS